MGPSPSPTHLYPGMVVEVEVKLCWVSDAHIHCGTSRNVTTLANLVLGWREEGEREKLERRGGGCDWRGKGERGEKRDQYSLAVH